MANSSKIYRFRLSTRVTHIVSILFFAFAFAATLWIFFLHAREPSDYIWGVGCLFGFGYLVRKFARQTLYCVFYRLEIGDQWVAMRDLFSLIVIPFSKLVGFAEAPMNFDDKLSGYRFGFFSTSGEQVLFST